MHGQMKRHEIQVLREAGRKQGDVAEIAGVSERSVRRIEQEPAVEDFDDKAARDRRRVGRPSKVDPWLTKIAAWLQAEPDVMSLELLRRAREDGFDGGKSQL